MDDRTYYVYMVTNRPHGVLYVGITNDLERRVHEHRSRSIPGFTKRYNLTRLVYFTSTDDVRAAIAFEKVLKGWRRSRKVELIESHNPDWRDLSEDWYPEEATG